MFSLLTYLTKLKMKYSICIVVTCLLVSDLLLIGIFYLLNHLLIKFFNEISFCSFFLIPSVAYTVLLQRLQLKTMLI